MFFLFKCNYFKDIENHTRKPEDVFCLLRNGKLNAVKFSMQNLKSLNLINYSENLSAYYKCDRHFTNSVRNYSISISKFRCSEDSNKIERISKIEYTCKSCDEWHVKVSSNLYKFIIYGENQYANLVSHIDIIMTNL